MDRVKRSVVVADARFTFYGAVKIRGTVRPVADNGRVEEQKKWKKQKVTLSTFDLTDSKNRKTGGPGLDGYTF